MLAGWWLDRMAVTRAPLVERMAWFWHGHFATGGRTVRDPALMWRQNATLRAHGIGSVTTLARAMAVVAAWRAGRDWTP